MNTSMHRLAKNFIGTAPRLFKNKIGLEGYLTSLESSYENEHQTTVKNTMLKIEEKLHSSDPEVSKIAANELANIGLISVDILTKALRSDINHVAINAANGIKAIGPNARAAVFDLTGMIHHSDVERREIAAATLGILRSIPSVSIQALAKALRDDEFSVRQYASAALGEFDGDDLTYVINALQRAARDDDKNVREFAKYALSKTCAI